MTKRLAAAVASALRDRGADTAFGLPGGGPNLDVVGAAATAGIRFVLAHAETNACIMAATYGLLTGRPAMALATRGPGAASAVNGAAQATLDRFPLLLLTDCVPAADRPRVAHQRLDQQRLLAPVAKWSGPLADTARAPDVVRAALHLAGSLPAGAVHLDFDPSAADEAEVPEPHRDASSSPGELEAAVVLVRSASRPVAIVGAGALRKPGQVVDALERWGCPVLVTYQAIGFLPDGHPQLAGLFTNGAIEGAILREADLVVTIGLDHVEPMPFAWRYDVPVLAIAEELAGSTLLPLVQQVVGPLGGRRRAGARRCQIVVARRRRCPRPGRGPRAAARLFSRRLRADRAGACSRRRGP